MITLFVHYKDKIEKVEIDPLEKVSSLEKYVDLPKRKFFFWNNCILFPLLTFKKYGIKTGDHIFVIKEAISSVYDMIKETFNKSKTHLKKLKNLKRIESFKRESAKIKDILLKKMERKDNSNRLISTFRRYVKFKTDEITETNDKLNKVDIPKDDTSSMTELPSLWFDEQHNNTTTQTAPPIQKIRDKVILDDNATNKRTNEEKKEDNVAGEEDYLYSDQYSYDDEKEDGNTKRSDNRK